MELKIENILPNLKVQGILHCGAHHGQEWSVYKKYDCPVIFIEPCRDAFKILQDKFSNNLNVALIKCAMGAGEFTTEMYIEKSNNLGASNSVLKPKKHLEQYPEIQFTEREEVEVKTLDSLPFDRNKYNILVIDTQGYELEVLKGAVETLKHIDCVYTEANREELYEGCAMIEELDSFLEPYDLIRTQADWRGGTWGDAVYEKGGVNKYIVIPSCDKYSKCWHPLSELIKKYVPLGWKTMLITDQPEKSPFDINKSEGFDYGWIENLKIGLANMSGIALMIQDDFFPNEYWDIEFIRHCTSLMVKDKSIGCFRLYPCPGPEDETILGEFNGITYGEIHKGEPYRISCQSALWNIEFLTSILNKTGGSAGNFEINGSRVDVPGRVLSVLRSSPKWAASYLCSGISRGEWNPDSFKLFKKEDIKYDNG